MAAVMYCRDGYPETPYELVFPDVAEDDCFATNVSGEQTPAFPRPLYNRNLPPLPCKDLLKRLRLVILSHCADVIRFATKTFSADFLLVFYLTT